MKLILAVSFLQILWIPSLIASVVPVDFVEYQTIESVETSEYISVPPVCNEETVVQWTMDFHECFMKRKYNDGGQNLESIVDRIMQHAEACVETSGKDCRPNLEGFKKIFGKVVEQIKDYASMYLQEIRTGRENIKDLKCVEDTLSLEVYSDCFGDISSALNDTDYEFQRAVKDGIRCSNDRDIECSREARSSLNRIARNVFSVEQPPEEEDMKEKEKPPPPKRWYDYIADPFVSAWNTIKDFFSGIFG